MQTLRGSQLRREVVELRDELKRTRASRDWYRKSRDHWKREAAAWRWGSNHGYDFNDGNGGRVRATVAPAGTSVRPAPQSSRHRTGRSVGARSSPAPERRAEGREDAQATTRAEAS